MVPCSSCKQWYHGSCESGDFLDPQWICIKCNKKRKLAELQQAKTRKEEDKRKKEFSALRQAAKNNTSQDIVDIYNCINQTVLKSSLPNGEQTIGTTENEDYSRISETKPKDLLGITAYDQSIDDLFIIIFEAQHTTKQSIVETIIHEIAHALHMKRKTGGAPHGKEYSQIGRDLTIKIKAIQDKFPQPYSSLLHFRSTLNGLSLHQKMDKG